MFGSRWDYKPYQYYVNAATTPYGVTPDEFIVYAKASSDTWIYQSDACGLPTVPANGPGPSYVGTTSLVGSIDANNTCLGTDGASVVSGGKLPGNTWAYACVYGDVQVDGVYSEADIVINGVDYSWSLSACTPGQYDLQSVLTHEFGHGLGIDHSSELDEEHQLLMSPGLDPCQLEVTRLLGLGDYNAFIDLYHS